MNNSENSEGPETPKSYKPRYNFIGPGASQKGRSSSKDTTPLVSKLPTMMDMHKMVSKNPSKNTSMKNLPIDEHDKRSSKSHRSSKANLTVKGGAKKSIQGSVKNSRRHSFSKNDTKNMFAHIANNEESIGSSDSFVNHYK